LEHHQESYSTISTGLRGKWGRGSQSFEERER
jgi:hypothetical protein